MNTTKAQDSYSAEEVADIASSLLNDFDEETDELSAKLKSVMAQVSDAPSDEVTVNVYRPADKGKKLAWLFDVDADTFITEGFTFIFHKVRDSYGGGEVRVRVQRGTTPLFNSNVLVEAPKNLPISNGGSSDELKELLRELHLSKNNAGQDNLTTLFLESMQRQNEILMQAVTNHTSPQQSVTDILPQVITMVSDLMNIKGNQSSNSDVLEVFLQGLQMGRDIEPQEKSTSDILLNGLETVMNQLQNFNARAPMLPAQTSASQIATEAGIIEEPVNAPVGNPVPAKDAGQQAVAQAINTLCVLAQSGASPQVYAHVVLDRLTDEQAQSLIDDPNALANLQAMYPQMSDHAEWFSELLGYMKEALNFEDEEPQE